MQYLGGKSRISHKVVAIIDMVRMGRPFWDPFCGGLSPAIALSARGRGRITDANLALISLYKAVVAGWDPPTSVTEEEYEAAKTLPDTDPRKAFIGFGCAFRGMWFKSYAQASTLLFNTTDYPSRARRSLLRDIPLLARRGCYFEHLNFLDVEPSPINQIIYLDPPYKGVSGYDGVGGGTFDHEKFYERVAAWGKYTDVFISEYQMPVGEVVLEIDHYTYTKVGQIKRTLERLYHVGPSKIPTARPARMEEPWQPTKI